MEEMSPAVVVPFRVGNSVCDNPNMATPMDITRLKLMADTAGLLSDSVTKASDDLTEVGSDDCKSSNGEEEIGITAVSVMNDKCEGVPLSVVLSQNNSNWGAAGETISHGSEEDDSLSLEGDHIYDSSCSHSVISETSSICGDEFLGSEASSFDAFDSIINAKDISSVEIAAKANIEEANVESFETQIASSSSAAASLEEDVGGGIGTAACDNMVLQLPLEKKASEPVGRSVFEVDCVPLWGYTSVCGRRPEMEDAAATVPRFSELPVQMLVGDRVLDGSNKAIAHQTVHFFGVYDGHGGSQVANFCRERMHLALSEEIELAKHDIAVGNMKDNCQELWRKAFTNCFLKVDAEIGGGPGVEPVAPETVGSTAVVAIICASHIIVANCGDSRAVLCRGKEPMALSVDHKPNRADEYERIEAAGGKVIQWNGHRVFGVLAMSRSIGDRYLKPWIIPEPEVMFVPRAKDDECLVLASDGLWDVMTNEEVCDLARRRILLWHKKNGVSLPSERGLGIDPAAQAAAEYLSNRALQKGSKDNITVIVIDLKTQRKFKTKS
ncbi:protein phosphatase 2C 53 isoform X1 [Cucumis sativus]|uniref:protein-serine/threonine phosphatase n=1 Tax=Cucumis sativus TaxID=3659 RepID=A0A0A0KDK8_CUCSA|nr:protein phosphatase 2C 53 isoform X1 [Cucumis sativus]XP_011657377.1 protein phosphatase 2C 53 isoform X1 [Cucumis sativus]XP_011657378.1 protein phosphatase 2C 53 isoform X1 [Cucumis sativus]XP_011657379.1 protein phosphatase 2C 53 isoform X1 [Cucumis sativus]XP_031742797.1 protein phosphatase 2C 53 isoform X1 [Cucumis sativus]XP_031742798.1 protein phosphatase 2C 53 isoform X1 [Cucumis sativus]XP_031742799.1 protein phosphatase 2C 53 isoform X1 [Cucumis sativus]XP_031742800.1 protein ph